MRRAGLIALAFGVMIAVAFGSLVRFGTPRDGAAAVAAPEPEPAAAAHDGALVVPVAGVARASIADTWGQARAAGRVHHGTDIMAPRGLAVVAAADGVVEKLFASKDGGITLYERSPDGTLMYYYAHLAAYAPGVAEGLRLRAGQQLGYVGDTGNAGAGNFHLHFGISRMTPAQRWWEGEPINPYPLLARAGPAR